jgi:hypothetical protein
MKQSNNILLNLTLSILAGWIAATGIVIILIYVNSNP